MKINKTKEKEKINCAVLVLGDLNRSPRMLNHCAAISECFDNMNQISLIGFNGGDLRSDIATDKKIKVYNIPDKLNNKIKKLPRQLFILSAFLRIIIQIFELFYILFTIPKPKFILLQNPPGIPSMLICVIVCFFRRCKFIIDWHNYGFTILEVNKRNRIICKIAYFYEKIFAKTSHLNFCVSKAMKSDLKQNFGIEAIYLPDRPMKNLIKFLNKDERTKLIKKYNDVLSPMLATKEQDKPIVMISSTSWTPDEDFSMLLQSIINTEKLIRNDSSIKDQKSIKKVLFLITGRGPMKDQFMAKVKESKLTIFDIRSIWLDSDDYLSTLSIADLGVSLHYSSSGIDLPMKVVDMFSVCLPAVTVYYKTIGELVQEEYNGFIFQNEEQLSKILKNIIEEFSFKGGCEKLNKYKENLKKDLETNDWITYWSNTIYPQVSKFVYQ